MIKKFSKIIITMAYFSGSEIMAKPLKTIDNVSGFVLEIQQNGSDREEVLTILRETIDDEEISVPMRIFILNEILETIVGRHIEIESVVNSAMMNLLSQAGALDNLPDDYSLMNMEMKLAHILWLSQIQRGGEKEVLVENYSASCLESICKILKHQKNGNMEYSENLHAKIKAVLDAKNIEMNQFEP